MNGSYGKREREREHGAREGIVYVYVYVYVYSLLIPSSLEYLSIISVPRPPSPFSHPP
jgi:dolichol kinase